MCAKSISANAAKMIDRCDCCHMLLILPKDSERFCEHCQRAYDMGRAEALKVLGDDGK